MDQLIQMINNKNDINDIRKYCLLNFFYINDEYHKYLNKLSKENQQLIKYFIEGIRYAFDFKYKTSKIYLFKSSFGQFIYARWPKYINIYFKKISKYDIKLHHYDLLKTKYKTYYELKNKMKCKNKNYIIFFIFNKK